MILFADADSIVSFHLQETGRHETVQAAIDAADFVACSIIAYAEVRATFAKARREPPRLTRARYTAAVRDFNRDWRRYVRIAAANKLVRLAGDLAEKHALKGCDAVHLASAMTLRDKVADVVRVSSWDSQLRRAAAGEGFELAHGPG